MLKEEIQGPASFNCVGSKCTFSEPAMDDLISAIFGDDSIYLNCNSGECLHYTMVPGFDVSHFVCLGMDGTDFFLLFLSVLNDLPTGS